MNHPLIHSIIAAVILCACHASPIATGAWLMTVESVTEPPMIAIMRQNGDDKMSVAFSLFGDHKVVIPLQISKSLENPESYVVSGSVQFKEERKERYGPEVRLLIFHGEFHNSGSGSGRLLVLGRRIEKGDASGIEFGMQNLDGLVAEADMAIKAEGGADQPATRSESDPEGGDKPQTESEGRSW